MKLISKYFQDGLDWYINKEKLKARFAEWLHLNGLKALEGCEFVTATKNDSWNHSWTVFGKLSKDENVWIVESTDGLSNVVFFEGGYHVYLTDEGFPTIILK